MRIYKSVSELTGRTPLMELKNIEDEHRLCARVLAKLELFNPAGSTKDRVAKAMLDDAEAKGLLSAGGTIIEPTSGNTGIGLAAVGASRGYRVIIVMPDSIPAIVDKDLFEEVQLKIKKNSRAPARHKAEDDYLLTTKLFCGMCGAMMFGECGTGRNKVVHHYYKCATAKRFKTCKKKTVRKEWLEDLVIAETMKLIQDDAVIDAIVAEVMELQDQENTTLPLLEKQMREVENGIENMLNAIQAGVLTNSTKSRLEKLEAQQKELEVRIAEEKIARPRLSENQVRFWLTRFRKLDPNVKSHRETLINTFVNAVYLYDEKVLIAFNYKDGTKTITFDEIAVKDAPEGNGSDLGCFAPPKNRNVSKYAAVLFYDTFSCCFCFALPSEQLCKNTVLHNKPGGGQGENAAIKGGVPGADTVLHKGQLRGGKLLAVQGFVGIKIEPLAQPQL